MIRVSCELIRPDGSRRELARLDLSNDGVSPDPTLGNYSIQGLLVHPNGDHTIIQNGMYGFERFRWNVLGLLYAALVTLGEEAMRANPEKGLPE